MGIVDSLGSREELVGILDILGLVVLDTCACADDIDGALGIELGGVLSAAEGYLLLLSLDNLVVVHDIGAQIDMVVTLEDDVDAEVGHESAELLAHSLDILVVIVRAIGIERLVENDYLPLSVACLGVRLEPCELIVAERLILAEVVGVEDDEVSVVVIIGIEHAALSVLIDCLGQDKVLVEHISALLVVARCGHDSGALDVLRGIEEPLPLFEVLGVIDLVARAGKELALGEEFERGIDYLAPCAVLNGVLRLLVADMEEGEGIGIVRGLDYTRTAPPAVLCIADSVAILCAGLEAGYGRGVAVDIDAVGDEADNTEIDAGILPLDELGGRADLDSLGKLIGEGRILRILGYLNVGIFEAVLCIPVDASLGRCVAGESCAYIRGQAHIVNRYLGLDGTVINEGHIEVGLLGRSRILNEAAKHSADSVADAVILALSHILIHDDGVEYIAQAAVLLGQEVEHAVNNVLIARVAAEDNLHDDIGHNAYGAGDRTGGEELAGVKLEGRKDLTLNDIVEQGVDKEVDEFLCAVPVLKVIKNIVHELVVADILVGAIEGADDRIGCILKGAFFVLTLKSHALIELGALVIGHLIVEHLVDNAVDDLKDTVGVVDIGLVYLSAEILDEAHNVAADRKYLNAAYLKAVCAERVDNYLLKVDSRRLKESIESAGLLDIAENSGERVLDHG